MYRLKPIAPHKQYTNVYMYIKYNTQNNMLIVNVYDFNNNYKVL